MSRLVKVSLIGLALIVGITLALLSVSLERVGPELVQYGDSDYRPVLKGGFPFAYLFDAPGISVERQLTLVEDRMSVVALILDIAIYFATALLTILFVWPIEYKGLQMWKGKKDREQLIKYPEHIVRQHALRRLADVFQVAEVSLSPDHRLGEELKAAPVADFRFNEFDTLDDDIKWVADRRLLQQMATGDLIIHTVGDYCDHMVRCSQLNTTRVADLLKLRVAAGHAAVPRPSLRRPRA
jgi:hypothetical protein